jgi:ribosomal protein L32
MQVRVCTVCGEEYRPDVLVCPDCGGALDGRVVEDDSTPVRRKKALPPKEPASAPAGNPVRVCPDCGEEYRPDIRVCADCGGELVDGFEGAPRPRKQKAAPAEDLSDRRIVHQARQASEMLDAAEALEAAGVPFRVVESPDPSGRDPSFVLLVHERDHAAAVRALATFHGVDADREEPDLHPEGGYAQCPACGSRVEAGATECAECGLGLGASEDEDKAR